MAFHFEQARHLFASFVEMIKAFPEYEGNPDVLVQAHLPYPTLGIYGLIPLHTPDGVTPVRVPSFSTYCQRESRVTASIVHFTNQFGSKSVPDAEIQGNFQYPLEDKTAHYAIFSGQHSL